MEEKVYWNSKDRLFCYIFGNAEKSDVEVTVHMYNIRPQYRSRLIEACQPLDEYSGFI